MIAHVEMLLANRLPHEEKAGVRYTTLEGVVAEFTRKMQALEDAQDKLFRCTCDHDETFDLDEWLSAPSRINPLAAAAAVNMRKEWNS